MTLTNGSYHIFSRITNNKGNQLRLADYNDHMLSANDSSKVSVQVTSVGGNQFTLQVTGVSGPTQIAPSDNIAEDKRVHLLTASDAVWAIDNAGGRESYKVHMPEQNACWQIPESSKTADYVTVVLAGAQDADGEYWIFQKI
ncbi:hypothetical protein BDV93DRAFT_548970 [Ceratobasidium sp. AG-I]|nr:hypothetical protein BDV93DRAFT_548970 [Ceratobasidium sp. AG-I]